MGGGSGGMRCTRGQTSNVHRKLRVSPKQLHTGPPIARVPRLANSRPFVIG